MKTFYKSAILLLLVLLFVNTYSCKKESTPTTDTQPIIGAFTRIKTEVSNTNNGSDWLDISGSYASEILTFSNNGVLINNTSGHISNGTWALSSDGSILSLTGNNFKVLKLEEHSLIIFYGTGTATFLANNGKNYNYEKITYAK